VYGLVFASYEKSISILDDLLLLACLMDRQQSCTLPRKLRVDKGSSWRYRYGGVMLSETSRAEGQSVMRSVYLSRPYHQGLFQT
jgi:hypothetical protein